MARQRWQWQQTRQSGANVPRSQISCISRGRGTPRAGYTGVGIVGWDPRPYFRTVLYSKKQGRGKYLSSCFGMALEAAVA